jgi:hypothetical protein
MLIWEPLRMTNSNLQIQKNKKKNKTLSVNLEKAAIASVLQGMEEQ